MTRLLTRHDSAILLHGRSGSARDIQNDAAADFYGRMGRRIFRGVWEYNFLTVKDKPLFWEESEMMQRVIAQVRISSGAHLGAHISYLGREGTGLDGERASVYFTALHDDASAVQISHLDDNDLERQLFRDSTEMLSIERKIKRARKNGETIHETSFIDAFKKADEDENTFRFMLSPENSGGIPLRQFTRLVMDKLERELTTKLCWVATVHYDTGHPHIHIALRGKNEYGGELFIPGDILFHQMRIWSREIATNYRGERSHEEIREAYKTDSTADRFTALDRHLLANAESNNGVVVFSMFHAGGLIAEDVLVHLDGRLKYHEKTGLAKKIGPGRWSLVENIHEILRDKQISKDLVRQAAQNRYAGDEDVRQIDDARLAKRGGVFGKIIHREKAGALRDAANLIIQTADLEHFAIALSPQQEKNIRGLTVGEFVSVGTPIQYDEADEKICSMIIEASPDNLQQDNIGSARVSFKIEDDQKSMLLKRRLYQFAEGGICKIESDADGTMQVSFVDDAAAKIRALPRRRKERRTIVAETVGRGGLSAEHLGMTFADRFLMHRLNLSKDFVVDKSGEVIPTRELREEMHADWYLAIHDSICERIKHHIRGGKMFTVEKENSKYLEVRYSKNFTQRIWDDGANFAANAYRQSNDVDWGKVTEPGPGEKITGGVSIDERQGYAFIVNELSRDVVVLPLTDVFRKRDGQTVTFEYPALFHRNKQARDFYIKFSQPEQSSKEQGGQEQIQDNSTAERS